MMLNFLESDHDFEVKKILLKNTVTLVTKLQPIAINGFRGKIEKLQQVTKVTKKVIPVTNVTKKN